MKSAVKRKRGKKVDFDHALTRGPRTYESGVAQWWIERSHDKAHRRAYENIIRFIQDVLKNERKGRPKTIVDFATGNGAFLPYLIRAFPSSTIVGLDGSRRMLKQAKHELSSEGVQDVEYVPLEFAFAGQAPRVRLVRTPLPNFRLATQVADVAVLLFPNLVPSYRDRVMIYKLTHGDSLVSSIGKTLSKMDDHDLHKQVSRRKAAEVFDDLMHWRLISGNVHHLLKKGGLWFKCDYSSIPRQRLEGANQWKTLFTESALEGSVGNQQLREPFQYYNSRYFRSTVILDVYEQTRDPEDRIGGFFVSALRAR